MESTPARTGVIVVAAIMLLLIILAVLIFEFGLFPV